MFNYTHILKDKEGFDWGAFPNKSIANMMKDHLESRFPQAQFFVEEIL
jgi:hypothetical protein